MCVLQILLLFVEHMDCAHVLKFLTTGLKFPILAVHEQ